MAVFLCRSFSRHRRHTNLAPCVDQAQEHPANRFEFSQGRDLMVEPGIHDLDSDMQTRFSFNSADDRTPLWSPDDRRLVYTSAETSLGGVWLRPVSGQEPAKLIYDGETQISLTHWSGDGRHIFFNHLEPNENGWEVWALDMESFAA